MECLIVSVSGPTRISLTTRRKIGSLWAHNSRNRYGDPFLSGALFLERRMRKVLQRRRQVRGLDIGAGRAPGCIESWSFIDFAPWPLWPCITTRKMCPFSDLLHHPSWASILCWLRVLVQDSRLSALASFGFQFLNQREVEVFEGRYGGEGGVLVAHRFENVNDPLFRRNKAGNGI